MTVTTGSNKISNCQFRSLQRRLFYSYLTIMITILGLSGFLFYQFLVKTLYQQLDKRLQTLAQAAVGSLSRSEQVKEQENQKLVWQKLPESNQSIEWFNSYGNLLVQVGNNSLEIPVRVGFENNTKYRILTIPAYQVHKGQSKLIGFIRVNESTDQIEIILSQIRWGLGVGGIFALTMTGIGGLWLIKQVIKPIESSFLHLKQFTADASVELQKPLTHLKNSVDVMREDLSTNIDQKQLDLMTNSIDQMTHLVEDLLLLAQLDRELVYPDLEIVIRLDQLLEELITLLQPRAIAKKILLEAKLMTGIMIKGDPSQITRLYQNLLENALQYTLKGGNVTVNLFKIDNLAVVSIEDTGIGIASEDLNLIFNRFWRKDHSHSYGDQHLGIGLAIAQSIAQQYGGEIKVTSQIGKGSRFWVRLPISLI